MAAFFLYLQLEFKRMIKRIPSFLAGAAVLIALIGTVAFSAGKMLYGEKSMEKLTVGAVVPPDDPAAEKVLDLVTSLKSVGTLCDFVYTDREAGMEGLKSGELAALMVLPDEVLQGIMDGRNRPVTVIFPREPGPSASVFRELTEAGSSMLGTAQAGIYGADAYLAEQGLSFRIPDSERDLNRIFLDCALSREHYFRKETVHAAGSVGAAAYFGISAAAFLLILAGIPAASLMDPPAPVFRQKLGMLGVGTVCQTAARLLSMTALLLLGSAVPFLICLGQHILKGGLMTAVLWLLVCLAAASWILLIYEISGNPVPAVLLLFGTGTVMLFLSGGIVPSVFLPSAAAEAGKYTVTALLADGIRFMVTGTGPAPVVRLLLFAGGCFALAAAAGGKAVRP